MTSAEKDARRLLSAALQATSATTFISSTTQVFIADRLKTAQALLATSISLGGRRALVHVTRARDFVEAIEVPRLRENLEAALDALSTSAAPGLGRGYEGEDGGANLPPEVLATAAPDAVPAPPKERGRGWGFLVVAAAVGGGLWLARGSRSR